MRRLQESSVPLYERTRLFRVYEHNTLPGLLHTANYAREILGYWIGLLDLPDDREAGRNRWSIALQHSQRLAPGLNAYVNYNKVSDNTYPDDLGRSIVTATQR